MEINCGKSEHQTGYNIIEVKTKKMLIFELKDTDKCCTFLFSKSSFIQVSNYEARNAF